MTTITDKLSLLISENTGEDGLSLLEGLPLPFQKQAAKWDTISLGGLEVCFDLYVNGLSKHQDGIYAELCLFTVLDGDGVPIPKGEREGVEGSAWRINVRIVLSEADLTNWSSLVKAMETGHQALDGTKRSWLVPPSKEGGSQRVWLSLNGEFQFGLTAVDYKGGWWLVVDQCDMAAGALTVNGPGMTKSSARPAARRGLRPTDAPIAAANSVPAGLVSPTEVDDCDF